MYNVTLCSQSLYAIFLWSEALESWFNIAGKVLRVSLKLHSLRHVPDGETFGSRSKLHRAIRLLTHLHYHIRARITFTL